MDGQKMERMQALVRELKETAYAYYVLDNPVISDMQWDRMYDELVALERRLASCCPIRLRSTWAGSR